MCLSHPNRKPHWPAPGELRASPIWGRLRLARYARLRSAAPRWGAQVAKNPITEETLHPLYRDEPDVLLCELSEVSEAGFLSIIAFELSGGDDYRGLVTLEKCEPLTPPTVRSRTKTLFKTLLAKQPPVFRRSDDYLLVGQLDDSWRHPSHARLGKDLNDAQLLATNIPQEHVRYMRLVVKQTGIQLAYVIMLSAAAMTAVFAWEECGRSNDVKKIRRKINQLAPPV